MYVCMSCHNTLYIFFVSFNPQSPGFRLEKRVAAGLTLSNGHVKKKIIFYVEWIF